MDTFESFGITVTALVISGIVILFFGSIFINSIGATEGQHTGYVTAVEHNSNIIWDADLVYFKTDASSTQEDVYCVIQPDVLETLKQKSKDKELVTIMFKNRFFLFKAHCNGGISIIYELE